MICGCPGSNRRNMARARRGGAAGTALTLMPAGRCELGLTGVRAAAACGPSGHGNGAASCAAGLCFAPDRRLTPIRLSGAPMATLDKLLELSADCFAQARASSNPFGEGGTQRHGRRVPQTSRGIAARSRHYPCRFPETRRQDRVGAGTIRPPQLAASFVLIDCATSPVGAWRTPRRPGTPFDGARGVTNSAHSRASGNPAPGGCY